MPVSPYPDDAFMHRALSEAEAAFEEDEVPVGAVIVHEGRTIAAAHNQREQLRDPTAHAEIIAITQAAAALGDWRLDRCTLYVTLEPCPMCACSMLSSGRPEIRMGTTPPMMEFPPPTPAISGMAPISGVLSLPPVPSIFLVNPMIL